MPSDPEIHTVSMASSIRTTPWRSLLALVAVGLVVAAVAERIGRPARLPWHADAAAAREEALARGHLILAYYTMRGCAHCARLERDAFGDAGVRAALEDFVLLRIDLTTASPGWPPVAVDAVPALVALNPTGAELASIIGYRDAGQVRAFLGRAASRQK